MSNTLWSSGEGLMLLILGIFIFLKPDLIWKAKERWKPYRAKEPSDLHVISIKFGGVLFAISGIIMIILPFVLA